MTVTLKDDAPQILCVDYKDFDYSEKSLGFTFLPPPPCFSEQHRFSTLLQGKGERKGGEGEEGREREREREREISTSLMYITSSKCHTVV